MSTSILLIPDLKDMTTLLFFPNYLGGGFGHIARCMALAETCQMHGDNAVFALGGPHKTRVAQAGFKVYELQTPRYIHRHNTGLAYVHVSDMAYQIARDGFDHPRIVQQAINEARNIINEVHPDALVGDGYALTNLIGKISGLPVIQIAKSVAHPQPVPLVWWETSPKEIDIPDISSVFNPVLKKFNLPPLGRSAELLDGDLLLLPSILPLDPMPTLPPRIFYVGPMVRAPQGTSPPEWLLRLGNDPLVYVTVGGASGIAGDPAFLRLLLTALGKEPYQVVISTGGLEPPADIEIPPNIHLVLWVAHEHILPRASAVIFHGGYTRMEILLHGLPSIIIPFHTEQEYYGRLIQRAGAGINLRYSNAPYQKLNVRWRGGLPWNQKTYSLYVRTEPTLQPATLRDAVAGVLTHEAMHASARALQQSLQAMDGKNQAYQHIVHLLQQPILPLEGTSKLMPNVLL